MLEDQLCNLYNAGGCLCFASGMGAISAVFLTFLKKDSVVMLSNEVYFDTWKCLNALERVGGITSIEVQRIIIRNSNFVG
jgi:cystathionine beta-lyase/cystathionine gamma-synthase